MVDNGVSQLVCSGFHRQKKVFSDEPDDWSSWMDQQRKPTKNNCQNKGRGTMAWCMIQSNDYLHIEYIEGRVILCFYQKFTGQYIKPILDQWFCSKKYLFQLNNCPCYVQNQLCSFPVTSSWILSIVPRRLLISVSFKMCRK